MRLFTVSKTFSSCACQYQPKNCNDFGMSLIVSCFSGRTFQLSMLVSGWSSRKKIFFAFVTSEGTWQTSPMGRNLLDYFPQFLLTVGGSKRKRYQAWRSTRYILSFWWSEDSDFNSRLLKHGKMSRVAGSPPVRLQKDKGYQEKKLCQLHTYPYYQHVSIFSNKGSSELFGLVL